LLNRCKEIELFGNSEKRDDAIAELKRLARLTKEEGMRAKQSAHFAGVLFASVTLAVGSYGVAGGQSYPNRLVKLVVPFAPGSPVDITARAVGDKLSASLRQPFVIENRVGAGGNIGTELVAKAAPDGYTLGMVLGTALTVNPSLYKKLPFDPENAFRLISIVNTSSNMLVVHPSVPVNSVAEFVAVAKAAAARREPISYGSGGNGTPGHLTMENFRVHAGFEATHVPYRGNPPVVADLVAGQVKFGFVSAAGMMDHVRAGRLKALGVSRDSRSPLAPEVPTIAESGYPSFNVENLAVMLAPAGIPEPIAQQLEGEVKAALKLPDVVERLRAMDITALGLTGPAVRARIKADREAWAKVIAAAGMSLD
jgi:tripartite-type tricarboxylate transporter receptor subunit TctC